MRALVTGGAGFVGSNLVDALVSAGHSVTVVDDLSTGRRENIDGAVAAGAALHEVDITDAPALAAAFAAGRPEVVFHLAAQVDVRRSVADPGWDARVNVAGTANVLEAARAAGCERVVFASTGGAIYGEAETVPTPEEAPQLPLSPYGAAKAAGETYLNLYGRLYGLRALSLRLANVYGPRQDPLGEGGVVAIFSGAATQGRPVPVYGDGRQTRDFVYVGDVAAAFLAGAEREATGVLNVGTGEETSVLDLVAALGVEPRFEPQRPGEVRRSCLDPSAAERTLGWRAGVALPEGLRLTRGALAAS
jgi:UDP-glucose 4-epimerase